MLKPQKKPSAETEHFEALSVMYWAKNGVTAPSTTQLTNFAHRYIKMGIHFEVLMEAVNKHESLKFKWEDLVLLLKLTEGHDGED
jgi:hypothetical protein